MDKFVINGGKRLFGNIAAQSAKNSVLPLIAGAMLTKSEVVINNCPPLSDIVAMCDIIRSMGGMAEVKDGLLCVDCSDAQPISIPRELTGKIRSSIFILGSIISRFRRASISYPGGCEIGLRPIDLHLSGLRALGVNITEDNGIIECNGENMRAGTVILDFPSVGATENIMLAAVLLAGETTIVNAAREPEIVDLQDFINALGGRVSGAGTSVIKIRGVKKLHGCVFTPIADRIFTGTVLTAVAATGGDVTVSNIVCPHLDSVLKKLDLTGADIERYDSSVRIKSDGRLAAIDKIETQAYPGFPTDMQAQFCAMLIGASGTSVIVENLFENRYKYTQQLVKLGAQITVKDRVAVIRGTKRLHPSILSSPDLRGGAALTVAALAIKGESQVENVEHIDRGYYALEDTYALLGAEVKRVRADG